MGQIHPRATRVLLVEDDILISMMIEDAMMERGFEVHAAANAADALALLRSAAPIDVLFTDIHLADGMDGAALARRARELRPALAVVYSSGSESAVPDAVPGSMFVPKPYAPAQVCAMLARIAAAPIAA
jgi:CheY-like chemotaxis protein